MTFLSKIHPEFIPFDRKYFLKKLQEKYEQKVSQLVFSFYLFTTQILKLIENLNSVTSMALFLYKKKLSNTSGCGIALIYSCCSLTQADVIILRCFKFDVKLLYCHKISREENFAIFANGPLIREIKFPRNIFLSSIREIKFPRKKSFSLQFREIFPRKVIQACLGR